MHGGHATTTSVHAAAGATGLAKLSIVTGSAPVRLLEIYKGIEGLGMVEGLSGEYVHGTLLCGCDPSGREDEFLDR